MENVWQRWVIKKKKNGQIKRAVRIYIYEEKKLRKGGKRLLQGRDRIQAGPRVQSVKLFHIQGRFTFALEFAIARFHDDVKARPEAERVPDESGGDL